VSGTTRRTHERLRLLRSHRAMLRPGPGVGPQTGLSRRVPHTSRVGTCELREKQINDRATLSETSFLVEGLQGRLLRRRRGGRGRLTRRGSGQFQSRVRPMHTATGGSNRGLRREEAASIPRDHGGENAGHVRRRPRRARLFAWSGVRWRRSRPLDAELPAQYGFDCAPRPSRVNPGAAARNAAPMTSSPHPIPTG
jgi:hypothetical protein